MTFADVEGFEQIRQASPASDDPPSAAEQALLRRHQPRLYLPNDHPGPISFYDDYVAQGRLYDPDGNEISGTVDRDLLNAHKDHQRVLFRHEPRKVPATPVAFGRIRHDHIRLPDAGVVDLTFLTYHFVFRTSGLPAGLPRWQWGLASLFNAHLDWHQLDHYTAATLVLDADERPVALKLQQHNYMRSYLYGLDLPELADGRPEVTAAIGSNELYPHHPERRRHRAVPYIANHTIAYLVLGEQRPRLQADDITHGEVEVPYRLDFLPPSDAFYTFRGWLGARRRLPGRTGPPGADYNTLPAFKPVGLQLMAFYWHHGHADYVDLVQEGLFGQPGGGWRVMVTDAMYTALARRFQQAWQHRG